MPNFFTRIAKPNAKVLLWLILFAALTFVSLGFLDFHKPMRTLLDSEALSLKIGNLRISAYMLLQGTLAIILLVWTAGLVSDFGASRIRNIQRFHSSSRELLSKCFQIFVYFIAFLLGMDILGIDLKALTIFGGAVGIGLGFGLQKITANFISGMILLFERSIKTGDLIELSTGTYGFIRKMGARYTLIEAFEGKEIMIPNEDFIINPVVNWTYSSNRGRVDIPLNISYESNPELAQQLMLEAACAHPRCLKEPAPACFIRSFGDSGVGFLLMFWVSDVDQGRYAPQSEVMFSIWRKFKEHNIEISFSQHSVHLKTIDGKPLSQLMEATHGE